MYNEEMAVYIAMLMEEWRFLLEGLRTHEESKLTYHKWCDKLREFDKRIPGRLHMEFVGDGSPQSPQ